MGNRVRESGISFQGIVCGSYYVSAVLPEALGTWDPSRGSQSDGGNRFLPTTSQGGPE